MSAILDYRQAVTAGPAQVGGKAWNLGRLARWGFPVPGGIVVDIGAYDAVTENESVAPLIARAAAIDTRSVTEPSTQALLADIRSAIERVPLPPEIPVQLNAALAGAGIDSKPVAVRSSATAHSTDAERPFHGIVSSNSTPS